MKNKTSQQLLKSTKRILYVDEEVLKSIPRGKIETIEFFKLNKVVTNDQLEQEFISRGLIPANLDSLVAYDLKFPEQMDTMEYVGIQWKNKENNWCFAAFVLWRDGGRDVFVDRHVGVWHARWWFAGLRSSSQSSVPQTSDLKSLELRVEKLENIIEKLKQALLEAAEKVITNNK